MFQQRTVSAFFTFLLCIIAIVANMHKLADPSWEFLSLLTFFFTATVYFAPQDVEDGQTTQA